jgi:DNA mismatch repair protein MutS
VERQSRQGAFVPNDLELDGRSRQIALITGPNMAGKSTIIRQAGLIVLMAQIGSFVPARSVRVGVVDRIFTRVGASDNLARGESTFMVEMNEAANILNNATGRSLILMDELGRGTSTFDGMSIAWAIVEYLHQGEVPRPRTLFATHYHELTELAELLPRVSNFNVLVREEGDHVVFLHRLVPGPCDRSYGIHVAQMAGMPAAVVARAHEILRRLEQGQAAREPARSESVSAQPPAASQLELFGAPRPGDALAAELQSLDLDQLTPVQALLKLHQWRSRLRGEEPDSVD